MNWREEVVLFVYNAVKAAIAAAIFISFFGCCSVSDIPYEESAVCTTDSDCMFSCPPPADDPDCDGGPDA